MGIIKRYATEDYVDQEIAALVNSAPETLDTLGELATAFQEHEDVVDALNSAITNKQDKITETEGQFVVIGADGNLTVKSVPVAEGVSF